MRVRHLIVASMLLVATGAQSASAQSTFVRNTDRPGGDYRNFEIKGGDAACREVCNQERQCRAWAFVNATQRCWLKNTVPAPRSSRCCTSGVKQTQNMD